MNVPRQPLEDFIKEEVNTEVKLHTAGKFAESIHASRQGVISAVVHHMN